MVAMWKLRLIIAFTKAIVKKHVINVVFKELGVERLL
jgi:hypothetical protein